MLRILLTGCLFLTSSLGWAMSYSDEVVELHFAHDHKEIANKVESKYLAVMREEVKFPQGRQFTRLDLAIEMIEKIMNSEQFKQNVIGYERPNRLTRDNSEDKIREYQKNYLWRGSSNTLSNEDIYKIIMEGNEKMRPDTLGEMNLNIKKYRSPWWNYKGKGVIGYTNPSSSKWIMVNWRHYYKYDVHQMVGNIVHEWIHLLGFLHGKNYTSEEVPYVVGRIASDIAREMLAENDYSSLIARN